jgi:NADPH2:quinone reductase
MTGAIQFARFGGPEVLEYTNVPVGDAGPGEARIAHSAIGLNFIDVYYRTGLYPISLPSGLGSEGAGVVVSVGGGVGHVRPGDRVAYTSPPPLGAYAQERVIDARWLVRLPDGIADETGAAMMLKGLTSWYLLKRSYPVQAGEWVLLYAAAGGVGSITTQWARHLGVRVIGVVGTPEKQRLALAQGCEHALLADDDVVARVRSVTGGAGVPVVYDSVGRDTFFQSLDCLRTNGLLVSFGNSSGKVEPFSLQELTKRGSLHVTRPTLFDFIRAREHLEAGSGELFDLVQRGIVRIEVPQRYSLRDAATAHRELQARRTMGSTVLVP